MNEYSNGQIVEAIDDGRIVRVPEKYALREGLPILRRKELSFLGTPEKQAVMKDINNKERSQLDRMDALRRPLRVKNNVIASLSDNFHWHISSKRREFGWSRKQLAERINASEAEVKMIENGFLPKDDFILINKIEQVFGINLRKENVLGNKVFPSQNHNLRTKRKPLEKKESEENTSTEGKDVEELLGNDIEIELES
ncbi:MAG: hypothetical protein Q8Q31_00785 [Nanoarchaeota archaeon]|nr:hypothetical protein [Nanoarchaeota archaeon]